VRPRQDLQGPQKNKLVLFLVAILIFSCAATSSVSADQTTSSTTTANQSDKTPPAPQTKSAKHTSPKKKIVHEGGTTEPTAQLAPGMTPQQAAQQRQNTEDLLASTESNLQKLSGRSLNQDKQATVDQVKDFMKQARAANEASDFTRARNLAFKAQLLSEDLVRH
jgi:hypothetical protein